jgi:hypothetical protein
MVENICGQGFAYAREVKKIGKRSSQTRAKKRTTRETTDRATAENYFWSRDPSAAGPFIAAA